MAGDMEVDPAAIQGFATFLADAKAQLDKVKTHFDKPNANAEDLGRYWKSQGDEYVNDFGTLGPDLAALSAALEQIGAQLTAGAELMVAGETAAMDDFKTIAASGDTPSTESGGV